MSLASRAAAGDAVYRIGCERKTCGLRKAAGIIKAMPVTPATPGTPGIPGTPGNLARHRFVQAVAAALRKRCGVREGARLVVGVSGGADSVALLRALACIAPRRTWRLQLAVGHVQHHLRTDGSAEGDARFVAELAAALDVPHMRADLTPPDDTSNRERWARDARYEALAAMARAFDAEAVLVAHHADDQLETVLMRLLRGSSARGLAGMAWRRPLTPAATPTGDRVALLRPMLAVDRSQALAFLRDLGQSWREDHTNQDASRTRARLRRDVTPVLHELRADVAARAVALADHWRDVAKVIDREVEAADRLIVVEAGRESISRVDARRLPRIALAGLLRRRLRAAGVGSDDLGSRQLAPVLRAARDTRGGRRLFQLARGVELVVTRETLSWPAATDSAGDHSPKLVHAASPRSAPRRTASRPDLRPDLRPE